MTRKRTPRKPGRPPTVLVDDPLEERERGEYIALMRQRKYERYLVAPSGWPLKPPMQPTCEFDRGLVYARYAGHVTHQAVRSLRAAAGLFRAWIGDQRAAHGPARNIEKTVTLFLAIQTVSSVRKKLKLPKRRATPREVAQVLELLDGVAQKPDTIKTRMARLRPHVEGFEVANTAARRERRKIVSAT